MRRAGSVQITPRLYRATITGEIREDISSIVTSGKVTYDQDRDIQMSFSSLVRDPSAIEGYQDFLAPYLTLTYSDGYSITEPLGLYVAVPPKRDAMPQFTRGTIDGRDLTWLLASDTVDGPYTITAGTNRVEAVRAILDGMGLRHSIPDTALTFAGDETWAPGTRKLRLVNDVLLGTNMYAIYMRRDGWLTSMAGQRLSSVEPAVRYAAPAEDRVRVVRSQSIEPDMSKVFNKITVVRDDPSKTALYAVAINDDPESPVSTTSLGMTLAPPEPIRNQHIATQAEADALALRYLEEAASVYTKITLNTTPDPSRNPHEVYELAVSNRAGAVAEGKWWCGGWQIGFTPADGPMRHDLRKLVPFEAVL